MKSSTLSTCERLLFQETSASRKEVKKRGIDSTRKDKILVSEASIFVRSLNRVVLKRLVCSHGGKIDVENDRLIKTIED